MDKNTKILAVAGAAAAGFFLYRKYLADNAAADGAKALTPVDGGGGSGGSSYVPGATGIPGIPPPAVIPGAPPPVTPPGATVCPPGSTLQADGQCWTNCAAGFTFNGGMCVPNAPGATSAPPPTGATGPTGSPPPAPLTCAPGFEVVGNRCLPVCGPNSTRNSTTGICDIPTTLTPPGTVRPFTAPGTSFAHPCPAGYVLQNVTYAGQTMQWCVRASSLPTPPPAQIPTTVPLPGVIAPTASYPSGSYEIDGIMFKGCQPNFSLQNINGRRMCVPKIPRTSGSICLDPAYENHYCLPDTAGNFTVTPNPYAGTPPLQPPSPPVNSLIPKAANCKYPTALTMVSAYMGCMGLAPKPTCARPQTEAAIASYLQCLQLQPTSPQGSAALRTATIYNQSAPMPMPPIATSKTLPVVTRASVIPVIVRQPLASIVRPAVRGVSYR